MGAQIQTERDAGGRDRLREVVVVVALVVEGAATKVKRVCDYVGKILPRHTRAGTHIMQFLLSAKMLAPSSSACR